MRDNITATITFDDGFRFYLLMNGKAVDEQGSEITRENYPDRYDDVMTTITPNAVLVPFSVPFPSTMT